MFFQWSAPLIEDIDDKIAGISKQQDRLEVRPDRVETDLAYVVLNLKGLMRNNEIPWQLMSNVLKQGLTWWKIA